MGVKAFTEDLMAIDEAMERESTGVSQRMTTSAPISHVRLQSATAPHDARLEDTWDETTHPTWDTAAGAPPALTRDGAPESDAARLVSLATRMSVGDVMDQVFAVRPDTRVEEIAQRLRDEDIIVADRNGVPLGVVQRCERPPTAVAARAGELMEPIHTLEKMDRLSKALGLMAAQGIPCMCVVSSDQCVVGMIYANRALARLFAAAERR